MNENVASYLLLSTIFVAIIVIGLCSLGGCYICNQTEREYIKSGYVQKKTWDGRAFWIKEGTGK